MILACQINLISASQEISTRSLAALLISRRESGLGSDMARATYKNAPGGNLIASRDGEESAEKYFSHPIPSQEAVLKTRPTFGTSAPP